MRWISTLLARSRNEQVTSKKVTLEFTENALQVMEWCARRQNKTLQEWIHYAIERAIPGNAAALHHGQQLAEAAMNAVHSQLDGGGPSTPLDPLPILSSSVDASIFKEPTRKAPEKLEVRNGQHPCVYLMSKQHQLYEGMSEGTCSSPQQSGRVCFWGVSSARQCPAFKPKRVTPVS